MAVRVAAAKKARCVAGAVKGVRVYEHELDHLVDVYSSAGPWFLEAQLTPGHDLGDGFQLPGPTWSGPPTLWRITVVPGEFRATRSDLSDGATPVWSIANVPEITSLSMVGYHPLRTIVEEVTAVMEQPDSLILAARIIRRMVHDHF